MDKFDTEQGPTPILELLAIALVIETGDHEFFAFLEQ
jgi:hypothetical protein